MNLKRNNFGVRVETGTGKGLGELQLGLERGVGETFGLRLDWG